jgi:hypothetical protein
MEGVDTRAQKRAFFEDGGGAVGIVPESIPGNLRFDFLKSFFLAGQVKDTP